MNKPRRAAQVSLIHDCGLHARRMHVGKDRGRGEGEGRKRHRDAIKWIPRRRVAARAQRRARVTFGSLVEEEPRLKEASAIPCVEGDRHLEN